ncbi:MAG: 4-hydroxybutyryl-CoA dehydratase [Dehalococcoidia bacterium]|nr:4-hydroxybutyryl-CoA dehydratase [Dehalococcoidia bacterium]
MGIMTGNEYRASLKLLKPEVYFMGEKIKSILDHPAFIPHIKSSRN